MSVEGDAGIYLVDRGHKRLVPNPNAMRAWHLHRQPIEVVTRAELEKEVWGEEMPDSDSLRVHIHSLRAQLDKPFGSKMIQTRHGIGYRLMESDAVST